MNLSAITSLDQRLFLLLNGVTHTEALNLFFLLFSKSPLAIWIIIGIVFMLIERRIDKVFIARLVLALAIAGVLASVVIKPLVRRPRPDITLGEQVILVDEKPAGIPAHNDFSFPSGHAAIAFAGAYIVTREETSTYKGHKHSLKQKKLLRMIFISVAFLTAISRIYLGKHYPLDVLAGGALGWGVGKLAWWIVDLMRPPSVS